MKIPEEDRKEILALVILSGILDGLMSPDCLLDAIPDDISIEDIEDFFFE
tara:strand:+ start:921 stop:1070 length:150 start_codon:yes stop_codon:yes gene_type:complete